ncbi:putative ATP-binding protein [Streptomyces sp. NBRC 110611]|nr:putative ATP-binding protein [Streptomyces sp. NBRC 110611]
MGTYRSIVVAITASLALSVSLAAHADQSRGASPEISSNKLKCFNKEGGKYPPIVRSDGNDGGWMQNGTDKPIMILMYPSNASLVGDAVVQILDTLTGGLNPVSQAKDIKGIIDKIKAGKNVTGAAGALEAAWKGAGILNDYKGATDEAKKAYKAAFGELEKDWLEIPPNCLADLRGDKRGKVDWAGFFDYFSPFGWYKKLTEGAKTEVFEAIQCQKRDSQSGACVEGRHLKYDELAVSKSYWINSIQGLSEMKAKPKKEGSNKSEDKVIVDMVMGKHLAGGSWRKILSSK